MMQQEAHAQHAIAMFHVQLAGVPDVASCYVMLCDHLRSLFAGC